jgi:hypothetical protein
MAQQYRTVTEYVAIARLTLQDLVAPYRYDDPTILLSLNIGLSEMGRIRPDIFLDLKYQRPLRKGDVDEGLPPIYTPADITANTLVPVPSKYMSPMDWFIAGWCQFLDVTDAQDQRASGFMAKFQAHLTTLSAA